MEAQTNTTNKARLSVLHRCHVDINIEIYHDIKALHHFNH
jgi:hypothetical protein